MSELSESERESRARMVVTDHEGIFPMYAAFYVEAVRYASERAEAAFDRFKTAVGTGAPAAETVAIAHEALGHCAALSRFFFPASKKPLPRARGAKLKQMFAVSNNSPLQDRDLRNTLEHFDERLDEYLLEDIVGCVFPAPMVASADLADDQLGHIFRLVDPPTETFVLFGKKHPFSELRQEISRIAAGARSAAA